MVYMIKVFVLISASMNCLDHPTSARLQAQLLLETIRKHLDDNRRGEIIRSGIKLAIFGPPNAGKSSLLNFFGRLLLSSQPSGQI